MIIGLIFSAVYVAMWKFSGSFFANGAVANTQTFQYFSFTTLTTLGYGDFTAAGDGGRAVAVLEAIVGQMFLATLVARLVAGFRWEDRAAARRAGQQGGSGRGPGLRTPATRYRVPAQATPTLVRHSRRPDPGRRGPAGRERRRPRLLA